MLKIEVMPDARVPTSNSLLIPFNHFLIRKKTNVIGTFSNTSEILKSRNPTPGTMS